MSQYAKENMKALIGILILLFIFAYITYSLVSPKGIFSGLQNDLKTIEVEEGAEGYTDLEGNSVELEAFKGKPLIVNSWATWMPFSKDELVLLNEAKTTYGDGIGILAINRMEDRERVKSYLGVYGMGGDITFIIDPTDNFYRAVGGYAMPETVFYAADGTRIFHKRGVLTKEELENQIKSLLGKN
jgi:thiol-disulfide isomerase/thioredoxin